jgi:hypothetical protein
MEFLLREAEVKDHLTRVLVLVAFAVVTIASLAFGTGVALAQDANGTPGAVTPDPAACTVDGRPFAELTAIFESATPAAGETAAGSVTLPLGTPADAETTNAVTATLHEAVSCLNAGDFGRFLALLTPNAIVSQFSWIGEEIAQGNLTEGTFGPQAVPADQLQTVLAIGGVMNLADGRVAAIMVIIDPQAGEASPEALHLILVRDGDRLLIDEVTDFQHEEE